MMWKLREILEDSNSAVRIAKESKPKNDNKNKTKKKMLRDHGHNLLGFPLQAYFLCVLFQFTVGFFCFSFNKHRVHEMP